MSWTFTCMLCILVKHLYLEPSEQYSQMPKKEKVEKKMKKKSEVRCNLIVWKKTA